MTQHPAPSASSTEMKSITLHYTETFLYRVVRLFWWRKTGVSYFATFTLLAVALGYFWSHGDRSWWVGALAAVLLLGLTVGIAVYVVHHRQTLSRFRRLRTPTATLEMGAERFRLSSDVATSEAAWSTITEVWKFDDFWLLFFSPAQFVTIPLADLDDAARQFLHDRLLAHGAKFE
jgi:YcxB-like protein